MKKLAPLFGIIAVLLWGGSFTAGKIAYEEMGTYELLFIRMVISSLFFVPYIIYRIWKKGLPDKGSLLGLLALGFWRTQQHWGYNS